MKKLCVILALVVCGEFSPVFAQDSGRALTMLSAFRAESPGGRLADKLAKVLALDGAFEVTTETVARRGGTVIVKALAEADAGPKIGFVLSETLAFRMRKAGAPSWDVVAPLALLSSRDVRIVALADRGWRRFSDAVGDVGAEQVVGVFDPQTRALARALADATLQDWEIVQFRGSRAVTEAVLAGDLDFGFAEGSERAWLDAGTLVVLASATNGDLDTFGLGHALHSGFLLIGAVDLGADLQDDITTVLARAIREDRLGLATLLKQDYGGAGLKTGRDLAEYLDQRWEKAGALLEAAEKARPPD